MRPGEGAAECGLTEQCAPPIRIDPLTTPLRGAVPSPLQGEFGPQAALSAAFGGENPLAIGLRPRPSPYRQAGTSPYRGRPDESAAECGLTEQIAGRFVRTPSPRPAAVALSPFQGALGSEDLSRSDLFKCADVLFSYVRGVDPRCGPVQEAPPERGRGPAAGWRGGFRRCKEHSVEPAVIF